MSQQSKKTSSDPGSPAQAQAQSQEVEGPNYKQNYRFPNGALYTGTFLSVIISSGQWKNEMRHGYGTQIWPDGAKYEGYWKNNQANGRGKFWHVDGDVFEGEWLEDKANGFGTYTHKDGAKYEGQWKDDEQEGYGVESWADGSRYDGHYLKGKKHGTGTYSWQDGSKYSGDWVDNKITGKVLGLSNKHRRENTCGQTAGRTMAAGRKTKCTARECTPGPMGDAMRASIT